MFVFVRVLVFLVWILMRSVVCLVMMILVIVVGMLLRFCVMCSDVVFRSLIVVRLSCVRLGRVVIVLDSVLKIRRLVVMVGCIVIVWKWVFVMKVSVFLELMIRCLRMCMGFLKLSSVFNL